MEQRISLITLGVRDLAESTAFYERLGWKRPPLATQGVSFFQVGGLVLSLFPREHLAEDAGVPPEGSGFNGIAVAYNTRSKDEVGEVLAEAERVGGHIVKPAQDTFWGGHAGYFTDPDGYLWEVVAPSASTMNWGFQAQRGFTMFQGVLDHLHSETR